MQLAMALKPLAELVLIKSIRVIRVIRGQNIIADENLVQLA